MPANRINLNEDLFTFGKEKLLVEHKGIKCYAFRYSTAVCGLRIVNSIGEVELMPFQGQQIWRAEFEGRELTMKSMFKEPMPTQDFLKTYGAFLLHCGVTAMGTPGSGDKHPLHGELPNANYQKAFIVMGEDKKGSYVGMGGEYNHKIGFTCNYIASPMVKIYRNSSCIPVSITIRNLRKSDMELMYLAHINFRPVDNSNIFYTAKCTPENVKVRKILPSCLTVDKNTRKLLDGLLQCPEKHSIIDPGLKRNLEVLLYIKYLADSNGWAHSMQARPDGYADFVSHRVRELDLGLRWISRTGDEDALGLLLPATAGADGYLAEKEKGNIKILPAGKSITFEMECGLLKPAAAKSFKKKIEKVLGA